MVKPEPEAAAPDPGQIEAELRAKLAEVRDRLAALKQPPERGSGIGFGKRIGDGTTEAISRLNDVGVADSLDAIEARLQRALEKLERGLLRRLRQLRRRDPRRPPPHPPREHPLRELREVDRRRPNARLRPVRRGFGGSSGGA